MATSHMESDPLLARKQVTASSLSSASPPFYPSGSSNKEITLQQKREVLGGTTNRNLRIAVVDENLSLSRSNANAREERMQLILLTWKSFTSIIPFFRLVESLQPALSCHHLDLLLSIIIKPFSQGLKEKVWHPLAR
ncbi:uncharacterized protein LOC130760971 [Actinidia eriantha]|uniref:uncharacterized protein LOC130760971 n=1 Tax=Actinidia eriantha TaxID=165200 RepID=UPI00258CF044|nr:uncharacterized protein LOC130760971 [Actinidia eriantha]